MFIELKQKYMCMSMSYYIFPCMCGHIYTEMFICILDVHVFMCKFIHVYINI